MSVQVSVQIEEQIPVGDLLCQKDTFIRQMETKCLDCSEKPDKQGFYRVKLHDTSKIFPFRDILYIFLTRFISLNSFVS